MRRETKWLVVYPKERKEGVIEGVCGPIVRAYSGERVGGSYHFGPRFVYEVPMIQCAGVKNALQRAGFCVPHEFVTSQLARALAEVTLLPFHIQEVLDVIEEDDAEDLES